MNFLRRAYRSQNLSSLTHHHLHRRPSRHLVTSTSPPYTPPHHDYLSGSGTPWYRRLIPVGAAVVFYCWHVETVPYTNRRHFVPIPTFLERLVGELHMAALKYDLRSKILPPEHLDSVRVRRVSARIFSAVERGLGNVEPVIEDGSEVMLINAPTDKTLVEKGKASWSRNHPRQVIRWNWEVIVVKDDDRLFGRCYIGGKIVMSTAMLHNLHNDAEIATIIGHEVGHAIARHGSELSIKVMCSSFLHFVLVLFFSIWPDWIRKMADIVLFYCRPFRYLWNQEIEADHIGLFVLAEAGYDPHAAATLFDRFHREEMYSKYLRDLVDIWIICFGDKALSATFFGGDGRGSVHLRTHPSYEKRVEMLRRAEVMEEALQMYQKSIARRAHEGTLL